MASSGACDSRVADGVRVIHVVGASVTETIDLDDGIFAVRFKVRRVDVNLLLEAGSKYGVRTFEVTAFAVTDIAALLT